MRSGDRILDSAAAGLWLHPEIEVLWTIFGPNFVPVVNGLPWYPVAADQFLHPQDVLEAVPVVTAARADADLDRRPQKARTWRRPATVVAISGGRREQDARLW